MKIHVVRMNGPGSSIFLALGIIGHLVAAGGAGGGQFVLPGASHARLPGASTMGQIRAEIHKTRKYKHSF